MILPEHDGTFTAACDRDGCDWSFNLAGEDLAKIMDSQHAEGHIERDLLADSIARASALEPRAVGSGHGHGPQCTQESCPGARYTCGSDRCVIEYAPDRYRLDCQGHDVPTRAQLVGASTRRRAQPVGAGRRPPTSQPDEIPF